MKKTLNIFFLAAIVFLCVLVLPTTAQAANENDLTFQLNADGASYTVSACDLSVSGKLTVPAFYQGKPVTAIGLEAFSCCTELTDITISDGIEFIDDYAFYYCTKLQHITIPNSVTKLGTYAFSECSNLGEIVVPDSVTRIVYGTFLGCRSLENVTLPDSVISIGVSAFQDCIALQEITIPDGVTSIVYHTFLGCAGLQDVAIPDSVTSIEGLAFGDCTSLESIKLPDGLTHIGNGAFSSCSNLRSITIPNSIASIEVFYYGCNNLEFNIYDNAKYLGNAENPYVALIESLGRNTCEIHPDTKVISTGAFAWENLQSIIIPDGVTNICAGAFNGCYELENISIPDSVVNIGYGAFSGCSKLTYNVYGNAKYLGNTENPYCVLVTKLRDTIASCQIHPKTKIILEHALSNCDNLQSVTMPDGVRSIGSYAFSECDNITSIIIPDSVMQIGPGAFGYCEGLTEIVLPKYLNKIAMYLFSGCRNLQKIELPAEIKSIGGQSFEYCESLTSIVIPEGVTTIGWSAFAGSGLQSVVIPASVVEIDTSVLWSWGNWEQRIVFYRGTEMQKNSIDIHELNEGLNGAAWHYGVTDRHFGSQLAHHCTCCDLYYKPDGSGVSFSDIKADSWQLKPVNYAFVRGLMAGKKTDVWGYIVFDPNSSITREEFVQVLYNAEDKPSVSIANKFPDVGNGAWYKNAVLWANSQNIANGLGDGSFGIGKKITRQDLALMLYKYASLQGLDLTAPDGEINKYADGSKVSGYAQTAMNWAVKNGVLSGKGTAGADISTFRLDPAGTATRAECAAMLKNFMTAFGL